MPLEMDGDPLLRDLFTAAAGSGDLGEQDLADLRQFSEDDGRAGDDSPGLAIGFGLTGRA